MKTINISVDALWASKAKGVDKKKVAAIAESIGKLGLRNPITIRKHWDAKEEHQFEIIAGRHRYLAAVSLGLKTVAAVVEGGDEIDAELWQCSENLHRTNMNPHDEAVATKTWIALSEQKAKLISRQNASKSKKTKTNPKGSGRKIKSNSNREAAKSLGVDEKEIRRRKIIAGMEPDAAAILKALPEAIKATQADYLAVAGEPTSKQVAAAEALVKRKEEYAANRSKNRNTNRPNAITKAFDKAADNIRAAFVKERLEDLKQIIKGL